MDLSFQLMGVFVKFRPPLHLLLFLFKFRMLTCLQKALLKLREGCFSWNLERKTGSTVCFCIASPVPPTTLKTSHRVAGALPSEEGSASCVGTWGSTSEPVFVPLQMSLVQTIQPHSQSEPVMGRWTLWLLRPSPRCL